MTGSSTANDQEYTGDSKSQHMSDLQRMKIYMFQDKIIEGGDAYGPADGGRIGST